MGEFTFKLTKQPDFGDRQFIVDIGPTWPEELGRDLQQNDPGSIINGGSGVPVLKPEGRR